MMLLGNIFFKNVKKLPEESSLEKSYCVKVEALMLAVTFSMLSACGVYEVKDSAPSNYNKKWHEISDAIPVDVEPSKYGNPESYEVFGRRYYVLDSAEGFNEKGIASWYGEKFHGRRTSSGEIYDMYAMTAAHKSLPIPAYVEVNNLDNGRKAVVRVNDRGPFHDGRVIDLSYAAATKLGVAATGTANVAIRVLASHADSISREQVSADVTSDVDGIHVANRDVITSSVTVNDKPVVQILSEPSGNSFFIQVAAFRDESNAIDFLRKLSDQGFSDVRLYVESKASNPVYRVRVGPLLSQDSAQKVLAQLEQKNYKKLKIVEIN